MAQVPSIKSFSLDLPRANFCPAYVSGRLYSRIVLFLDLVRVSGKSVHSMSYWTEKKINGPLGRKEMSFGGCLGFVIASTVLEALISYRR